MRIVCVEFHFAMCVPPMVCPATGAARSGGEAVAAVTRRMPRCSRVVSADAIHARTRDKLRECRSLRRRPAVPGHYTMSLRKAAYAKSHRESRGLLYLLEAQPSVP